MRAQNPKQKTGGPSQAFAHWWKDSRYGDLGKAGGSFAQKQLWKPKVLAARAYELVRRLPNFKGIQKEIAAEDIRALRLLPPFPRSVQKLERRTVDGRERTGRTARTWFL